MFHPISNKIMNRKSQRIFILSSLIIILIILYKTTSNKSVDYSLNELQIAVTETLYESKNDMLPPNTMATKNDINNGCQFPYLDPWDPSIVKYIEHPTKVECKKVQPILTFIDDNGFLQYNETEYKYYTTVKNYTNLKCKYKTFDRSLGTNDNQWFIDTEQQLDGPVKLTRDMVEVKCYTKTGNRKKVVLYKNLHAHPALRDPKMFAKPTDDQLSVLLLIIDSISLSVLRRNMPLTYAYITKKMGMFMFNRFNKIADNTLPNMMAVLTGKRIYHEQPDMPAEYERFDEVQYYDEFPLIWKYFAAKKYATVFNEDKPEWGMFHYLTEGFKKKPTEYYYHTFWEAVRLNVKKNKSKYSNYCFGNTPKGDILLDITRRHLISMKNTLQFILTFFVEYSHDLGNEIERADKIYAEFWHEMFEDGFLNKTFVMFMSDHGHRYSSIRETLVGQLEERNPFLGIWFPEWFYDQHPHIKRNLQINTERFSSTFDIHETLKDILDANYKGSQRPMTKRGLSQLYVIPNRTCTQAGVPQHYCLCILAKPLNITLPLVLNASEIVVEYLNKLLFPFKQCQSIKYKSTLRAESVRFNEKLIKGKVRNEETNFEENGKDTSEEETVEKIRLAIKTQPNEAVFEATLVKNYTELDWTWMLEGDVERLNAYTNTSYCIKKAILRKYCTCK